MHPASFATNSATHVPGPSLPRSILVLGGARSGKSGYAERLIAAAPMAPGKQPLYIATAQALDDEMAERIRRHRESRGASWDTIEAPLDLAGALAANNGRAMMVDCLTLWLSNLLHANKDVAAERERLVTTVAGLAGPVALIANEVGLGIVPDNALARRFRDEAGWLNQALAQVCERVIFMAAGLPLVMKNESAIAATKTSR